MVELEVEKWVKKWIEKDVSLRRLAFRVYRKTESASTVESYIKRVNIFKNFMKVELPQQLLEMNLNWEEVLNDFIDYLLFEKGYSRNSIRNCLNSVKKWLEVNLPREEWLKIDWRRIELPQVWKTERDKTPSKEDLKAVLKAASLKFKALILILISSGLRVSTALRLRVKDIKIVRNNKLINLIDIINGSKTLEKEDLGLIVISPELTKLRVKSYITLITNEALNILVKYLRQRKIREEQLKPESLLFPSRRTGGLMNVKSVIKLWGELLKTTGKSIKTRKIVRINGKIKEIDGKWHIYHIHTLRKYFSTWSKIAGVQPNLVEFFMGHSKGVESVYQDFGNIENPQLLSLIVEEYRKATPYLTIMEISEEKIRKLEQQLEEERKKREQLEREFMDLIKKVEYLTKKLNEYRKKATNSYFM